MVCLEKGQKNIFLGKFRVRILDRFEEIRNLKKKFIHQTTRTGINQKKTNKNK